MEMLLLRGYSFILDCLGHLIGVSFNDLGLRCIHLKRINENRNERDHHYYILSVQNCKINMDSTAPIICPR